MDHDLIELGRLADANLAGTWATFGRHGGEVGGLVGDLRLAADPPEPESLAAAREDAPAVRDGDLEHAGLPLDEAIVVKVTAKPTLSTRSPTWHSGS